MKQGGKTHRSSSLQSPLLQTIMNSLRIKTLICSAAAALTASITTAAPWGPPASGDLILGFQATGAPGQSTNVFYNLGSVGTIKSNPNPGFIVNLNAELTAAFGANWYTRTDVYFGAYGQKSGSSTGTDSNGDPNRTAYLTRATNLVGGATLHSGYSSTALGSAYTKHLGMVDAFSVPEYGITANSNGVASPTETGNGQFWQNSWTKWNPLSGAVIAAFDIFNPGLQNNFGKGSSPTRVDLQRLARPTSGTATATYLATIEVASNGNVSIVANVVNYTLNHSVDPVGTGTISGATNGQSFSSGATATLTATANAGYKFSSWSGDASGTANPLSVLMNANKTVVANFVEAFPLTLSPTTNGTIAVTGGLQSPYATGTSVELTATPANGYAFLGWTGDAAGSTSPLSLTMDAAKTVGATFGPDLSDSDADGISRFTEIQLGTDPAVANSAPALPGDITFKGTTAALDGAEISAFDPASDRLFVTSDTGLQVVNLADPAAPVLITKIDLTVAPFNAVSNDVSSVAVHGGVVAASVLNPNKEAPGNVVFLDAATGAHLTTEIVGFHPDMVVFTPDGSKLLVANEGEYTASGPGVTPGSVTIISSAGGYTDPTVADIGFSGFTAATLKAQSPPVRIFGSETAANDLEPEYIAVSPDGTQAMVTLQENNAVAILDLATPSITNVVGLGTKDFSTLLADFSDRDNSAGSGQMGYLRTGFPVSGLYQPDAIASFTRSGSTFYVVANEGDDRNDFLNPDESAALADVDLDDTAFPAEADLKALSALGRLKVSKFKENGDAFGATVDQILTYGGRSFSILDAAGAVVYDSGDLIEKTIVSYGKPSFDDGRSDDKGPEPEGIAVASLFGRTVAFVGLERSNGVLILDITDFTDPDGVSVVAFLRNTGATRPEGIIVIPATDSPTGKDLVVVSNETSSTVSIFEINPLYNLTVTPPTNGTITVGGGLSNPYSNGSTVQLTAEPATGFVFTGWTGAASGTTNPLTVTMDADKAIGATFTAQYTVTVNRTPTAGGTVTGLATDGLYLNGATASLTATPAAGYLFSGWTVTGSGSNPAPSSAATLNFTVNGNKTVTATFAPNNTPGNTVFTVFQEASLNALQSRWEVGDAVNLDLAFFFNNLAPGFSISVVNLPPGLRWEVIRNKTTGVLTSAKIVGTITGELPGSPLEIRMLNARNVIQGLPLVWNFKVAPYRLLGRYEVLIENAGLPIGKSLLTVTGPGAYTATLELLGQPRRSVAKGVFAPLTGLPPYTVTVPFAAVASPSLPATSVVFTINPSSDLVEGSVGATPSIDNLGDSRGFRLANAGREPRFPVTIALQNAVAGNRTNQPGGQGYATGSFNPRSNQMQLTGALGDAQALTAGLNISQTRQAVVFLQPYKGGSHGTGSYFGGILTVGDLGQPSRGTSTDTPLTAGLKWRKVGGVATDKSYKSGFGPLNVNGRVDRWIGSSSPWAVASSLGLTDREVHVSYQSENQPTIPGGRALPDIFSLRNTFVLVRVSPANSVLTSSSRIVSSSGAFSGAMTLDAPAGSSSFNGVLLQDDEGTLIGTGLIKIFTNTAKDFETASISFLNEVNP
jgi:uncharacterized repeat protein (TIGR02543 family)